MVKDTPEEVLVSLNRKYAWDLETRKVIEDTSSPAIGFALLKVSHSVLFSIQACLDFFNIQNMGEFLIFLY